MTEDEFLKKVRLLSKEQIDFLIKLMAERDLLPSEELQQEPHAAPGESAGRP